MRPQTSPLPPASLPRWLCCAALAAFTLLSACDDDPSDANTDAATTPDTSDTSADPDATADPDTSGSDTSGSDTTPDPDTSDPQDATPDTPDGDTPPTCPFPAPRLAPEAAPLAASPARCGQAPYTWLDDVSLGDLTGYGVRLPFTASAINDLAASNNIALPKPAQHDVRVLQYRYMTQAKGQPIEATALAAFPSDLPADASPLPVLLILHGTTGFMDDCGPSSMLDAQAFAAVFASFGYFVVAPDYIGLKAIGDPSPELHPYLVGEPTAMASLDAVRAAGKLPDSRRGSACASPEVVVLGGSQGGHAALWVDRLAPYYAPELALSGTVATVPPADLLGQATRALTARVSATDNTIAMLGTHADWYGLRDRLSEAFIPPLDTQIPDALGASCDPDDDLNALISDDLSQTFQPALLDAAAANQLSDLSPWGCLFSENGLTTTSTPRLNAAFPDHYGVLFILGEQDQLVHTPIERAAFASLCTQQALPSRYLECASASHTAATLWAIPEIVAFIDDRLAHLPFSPACDTPAPSRCLGTPADQP